MGNRLITIVTTVFLFTNFLFASVNLNHQSFAVDSLIQNSDTLRFDYIVAYKEKRKSTKKEYKRYYLINTNDSISNNRFQIYELNGNQVLQSIGYDYTVEYQFNRLLLNENTPLTFTINKDDNTATQQWKSIEKTTKSSFVDKSKIKFKNDQITLKVRLFLNKLMVKKFKAVYLITDDRFKISQFSIGYFPKTTTIKENQKGVLKSADYMDVYINDFIELELEEIIPYETVIIIHEDAKKHLRISKKMKS